MELLKDYDMFILYHLCKSSVVENTLSRKLMSMGNLACLEVSRCLVAREVQTLDNYLIRL